MHKWALAGLALLPILAPAAADEPRGKLVKETWDAAYLEGAKVGFFRTTVHESERDGQKVLRTAVELNLSIRRNNATVALRMLTGTEETPDGKVTGVFMRQFHDKGQQLVLTGTVTGDQLHVRVDNGRIDKKVYWNDEVVGLYRQEKLYRERQAKPGDKITYLSYEPTINAVVTVRATVKDEEEVEVLGGKKRLLRVEAAPDKVEVPGASVQLPGMTSWLDKELLPVRSEMEMPGLGKIVLQRTTKAVATAANGAAPAGPDIVLGTLVPLNRAIARPHETKSAVYRITLKGDDDPATALARDDRQEVKNLKGNSFELHVRALREPPARFDGDGPGDEFLKSCYYLDSDNAKVKELARQAVGDEVDPWKKARRVEAWIHEKMRLDNTVAFCPASQVARDLAGDCRQHAMLTAAMCRAAGVPSRSAVGLVYVADPRRGPVLGFHMWAEVWVRGRWLALDATLGRGSVGAAHVKIADSSWYDTESQTPLLPVARVLGKLSVEVVSVNDE